MKARRFRSAGTGGRRGAPAISGEYVFSGSEESLPLQLKALLRVQRFRRAQRNNYGKAADSRARSISDPGDIAYAREHLYSDRDFQ